MWVALSLEDSVVAAVANCAFLFVVCDCVAIVAEAGDAEERGVCKAWDDVCLGDSVWEVRQVQVACVCGADCVAIWQGDRDGIWVDLEIAYGGVCCDEVACCSGVADCCGGGVWDGGVIIVVGDIVGKKGIRVWGGKGNGGGDHWKWFGSDTFIVVTFYFQCPTPSSLVRAWIDRENGLVDAHFGALVAHGLVLGDVLSRASGLVIPFAVVARGAGVPIWNVITARKTVVPVVEKFVGVRCRARTCRGRGRRGNAVRVG